MNIAVVGLGFVGLTTALGFAEKGNKVVGYEQDAEKAQQLLEGKVFFFEPGLPEALQRHLHVNFRIASHLKEAVEQADVIFYCVGTPSNPDGTANLEYLLTAMKNTWEALSSSPTRRPVFVIKSTVPPSTTATKVLPALASWGVRVGEDVGLANNPEFLREGFAWTDFSEPDRVVIGVGDQRTADQLRMLYEPFQAPIHVVNYNTGEFIKYLSNTSLATMISFSNEMSMIATAIGDIDVPSAFKIFHQDKRWSGTPAGMASYFYPGCGFGGYCLPKDLRALIQASEHHGLHPSLLTEVERVNETIKQYVVRKVLEQMEKPDLTIGVFGLAFKPNSDDVRETPAKFIIEGLLARSKHPIVAFDPLANEAFHQHYALPIQYASSFEEFSNRAHVIVVLTAWKEFRDKLSLLHQKKVIDFRYFLTKQLLTHIYATRKI